jgi:hypothetical protein
MKKVIIIILIFISLGILAWIFLFPRSSAPVINQLQEYLPFGSGEGVTLPPETDNGAFGQFGEGNEQENTPRDVLFQISKEPVAGSTFVTSSSTVYVRYVERSTGHIYDFDLNTFEKRKISNQTIPKVYEALFNTTGNKVIYRSVKEDDETIENTSLTLTPPRTTEEFYTLVATELRNDIVEMAPGSNNTLYYTLRDDPFLVSSNFEGEGNKTILSNAFTNWRLLPSGNSLIVWTKASVNTPGYAYMVNTSSGALTKIIGPADGLIVNASPVNAELLYSYTNSGQTNLYATTLPTSDSTLIAPATLAEKCAWGTETAGTIYCGSPSSIRPNEPDNWYRGITQFSDNLWMFNTGSEESRLLAEPKSLVGVDLDVYQPIISPNDGFVVFINKRDLSLWGLRIE